jgi:hypothetical protein
VVYQAMSLLLPSNPGRHAPAVIFVVSCVDGVCGALTCKIVWWQSWTDWMVERFCQVKNYMMKPYDENSIDRKNIIYLPSSPSSLHYC